MCIRSCWSDLQSTSAESTISPNLLIAAVTAVGTADGSPCSVRPSRLDRRIRGVTESQGQKIRL
jgi:hypothetical protein